MRIKRQFIIAKLHNALAHLGQVFVGLILLSIIAAFFVFMALSIQNPGTDESPIKVGLVTNNNEAYLDYAMGLVNNMNSVKNHFSFDIVLEEDGFLKLKQGEIVALMVLPDKVVEGIMSGANEPAQVYLSAKDPLSSILMQELAKAGASLLTSSQAGSYTLTDLYPQYDKAAYLSNAYNILSIKDLSYALSRGELFKRKELGNTHTKDYTIYYLCSAFLFILLVSGCSYVLFFTKGQGDLQLKLKSAHVGSISTYLADFFSVLFYQFILVILPGTGLLIFSHINLDALNSSQILSAIAVLMFICLTSSSFLTFLLSLSPDSPLSVMAIFLVSATFMLMSGCFLPLSFLPSPIRLMSDYLFTTHMMQGLIKTANIIFQKETQDLIPVILPLILFSVCFFLLGFLSHSLLRRRAK